MWHICNAMFNDEEIKFPQIIFIVFAEKMQSWIASYMVSSHCHSIHIDISRIAQFRNVIANVDVAYRKYI